jgi:hypothetical protein
VWGGHHFLDLRGRDRAGDSGERAVAIAQQVTHGGACVDGVRLREDDRGASPIEGYSTVTNTSMNSGVQTLW